MRKLKVIDDSIRPEQILALKNRMPEGWSLSGADGEADAILTSNADVPQEMIERTGASLKAIIKIEPGKATIAASPIPFFTIYDTGASSVAEHAMLLILALGRRLIWLEEQVKKQNWAEGKTTPIFTNQKNYTYNWVNLPQSGQLHGKKVGIVGFGFIGQQLALRLLPFNAKIFYYDLFRAPKEIEEKYGAQFLPLDELLQQCDFISLHLRFTEGENGNEKMFSKREFELMKPSAYFINTSRGRMVDEAALADAIRNDKIAGAGLDVFEYEPFKADCPLFPLVGERLILTPHVAGTYMVEAWETVAEEIAEIMRKGIFS